MIKDKEFSGRRLYVVLLFIGILIAYFLRFQYGTGTIKDVYGILQGLSVEQINRPSYLSILYVGIVRQLFLFLGVKNQVVIVFQVLVTLLSSFFLFLSVKKISNQETALITTAIYTLFPATMNACLYFDGMVLLALFFCIGFYFCISFLVKLIHVKEQQTSLIVLAIAMGFVIGIFQFLDVSFFSLFLMLQLTFFLIAKKTKEQRNGFSLKSIYLLQLLSYLAGLFLTIIFKAYASASSVKIVVSNIVSYFETLLFKPDHSVFAAVTLQEAFGVISHNIYIWVNAMHLNNHTYWFLGSNGNAIITGVLFILVLVSFIVVKQNRLFQIFFPFGLLVLSFLICLFLPFTYELQGIIKVAIMILALMSGIFIGTVCFSKQIETQTKGADPMNSIFGATKDVEKKAVSLQDLEANDTKEQKPLDGIKYIDNPLPVPKRHEKKTMDYDMVIPDSKMNYDLKTYKNNHDYDLK